MLQTIINWIMGNAFLVIIIGGGLFNLAVRLAQKTKEQRAKREAGHELTRQRQDAMRTGHTVSAPKPVQQQQPRVDPQAQRKERIEALRKERIDQLRALREKRAATSAQAPASSSSISQNHPNLPPIPVPRPTPQQVQPRRSSVPNPGQTRRPTVVGTPQQTTSAQRRSQQARAAAEFKAQFQSKEQNQPQKQRRVKKINNERQGGHLETLAEAKNPSLHDTIHNKSKALSSQTARSMLRSPSAIRQAMILREILDAPIAMRDQDIASGSLL